MIPAVKEALGPVYLLRREQNRPITKVSLKLLLSPSARYFWLTSRNGKKASVTGSCISHDVGWVQELKNGTLRRIPRPCTCRTDDLELWAAYFPRMGGGRRRCGREFVQSLIHGMVVISAATGEERNRDLQIREYWEKWQITSPINVISELVYELSYYQTRCGCDRYVVCAIIVI